MDDYRAVRVGKSAFGVFLTRLLCDSGVSGKSAWSHLQAADPRLAAELLKKLQKLAGLKKRLLPVLVTARRAPAALCLAEGLRGQLSRMKGSGVKKLLQELDRFIRDVRRGQVPDSRTLTGLIEEFAAAARRAGYKGVLLLVDELGKLFEYAARAPQRGDVFSIQEIAEQAGRSGAFPFLFFGFLHQSFEDYGQHLDNLTRKEWAKIQGRFEDVAFLEPAEQVMRMIAEAIMWSGDQRSDPDLRKRVRHVAEECAAGGAAPPGLRKHDFVELCVRAYPLHPLTLVSLPFIFRRFAQNERSLFSYLSSLEPRGFQEFLRAHEQASEPVFVKVHDLFDYFTINFATGLYRQPHARRWMEAADVLDRKEGLPEVQVQLVKTIGILSALGDFCHLRAEARMVSVAVADSADAPHDFRNGLQQLRERSILTFREFNQTYRLWEGSDVDIDDRVAEGRRSVRGAQSLAAGIQQYIDSRPLVARRHSFESGALRYFQTVYVDDPVLVIQSGNADKGSAGRVFVCIAASEAQRQAFRELATSQQMVRPDAVIAVPQQVGELLGAVTELAALRWAWDNTPALRDDRVARRELAMRVTEAEFFLRRSVGVLLDPRPEPLGSECLWLWNGEDRRVRSRSGVSQLLSQAADEIFNQSPRIRNELIVRRTLSSAAAAGRRELIERMLSASDQPGLGITGYPPERSIYQSVLNATGIHAETAPGEWTFTDPPDEHPARLQPAWACLRSAVFAGNGEPQPLSALFETLSEPPYGVMDGLLPVLLCAFIRVYRDEVTLYREGVFLPEPGIADFEILMRRPELFGLAGTRLGGARSLVVERIARVLQTPPATVPVVRALFRMVRQLPNVARRTNRVTEHTRQMRQAFEKARSPERFLFYDLPAALGLPQFPDAAVAPADVEVFFSRLNDCLKDWSTVAGRIHEEARETLLKACGLAGGAAGWQELWAIAARLEPRENDPFLRQVLTRILESSKDGTDVAPVLAFISSRPPSSWLDEDIERFPQLAAGLGESIRGAASRAGVGNGEPRTLNQLSAERHALAVSLVGHISKTLEHILSDQEPQIVSAALHMLGAQLVEGGDN